jgi:hypothetical protein
MKLEQQIKALAELDGWKQHEKYPDVMCRGKQEAHIKSDNMQCYLTSYDAIIPLIQKQSDVVKFRVLDSPDFMFICMRIINTTPAQLSEALLRATGKWIEL